MITKEEVEKLIADEYYFTEIFGRRGQVTLCVLKTYSGYECIGHAGTITPEENFDSKKGKEVARDRALDDLWSKYAFYVQYREYEDRMGVDKISDWDGR